MGVKFKIVCEVKCEVFFLNKGKKMNVN